MREVARAAIRMDSLSTFAERAGSAALLLQGEPIFHVIYFVKWSRVSRGRCCKGNLMCHDISNIKTRLQYLT